MYRNTNDVYKGVERSVHYISLYSDLVSPLRRSVLSVNSLIGTIGRSIL